MRAHIIILTCALAVGGVAAAQEPAVVGPSSRVRISAPAKQLKNVVGTVVGQRGDSLVVIGERAGDTLRLDLRDVAQLEVSRGFHRHTWAGASIGFISGGAIGVAAGYAMGDDRQKSCSTGSQDFCVDVLRFSAAEKATMLGGSFGILGGAIGAILGYDHRSDRWHSVLPEPPRVAVVLNRKRGTVRFGLRLRM